MKNIFMFVITITIFIVSGCTIVKVYHTNGMTTKTKKNYLSDTSTWNLENIKKDIRRKQNENNVTIYQLDLQYDKPLSVPQSYVAYCQKTYQTRSVLSIQNESNQYNAKVFISPFIDSLETNIYEISSNKTKCIDLIHNWNGAVLKIANISSEAACIKLRLY